MKNTNKVIVLILAACILACFCSCTKKDNNDGDTQSSTTAVSTREIYIMSTVFEGLMYAAQSFDSEYTAENPEYVWCAFAYILSNHGYGTLAPYAEAMNARESDEAVVAAQTVMNNEEAEHLMQACFGKDAKLLTKGYEKYFNKEGNKYSLKSDVSLDKIDIKLNNFSVKGNKVHAVVLGDEDEQVGVYNIYFEACTDDSSPYPLYVTNMTAGL